jgi:hypothetical protein
MFRSNEPSEKAGLTAPVRSLAQSLCVGFRFIMICFGIGRRAGLRKKASPSHAGADDRRQFKIKVKDRSLLFMFCSRLEGPKNVRVFLRVSAVNYILLSD